MAQNKPNISFIPKGSLSGEGSSYQRPLSFSLFLSVVILVLVIGAFGGLYFYRTEVVEPEAQAKENKLTERGKEFDKETVRELKRTEAQIKLAKQLLNSHVALTSVLALLEEETLETVRITQFNYQYDGREDVHRLVLDGTTTSFGHAAVLRNALAARANEDGSIRELEFRTLNLSETGRPLFTLQADIDPQLLRFGSGTVSNNTTI